MKNDWFIYQGVYVKWYPKSPINRAAFCEAFNCKGTSRRVERDAPRLCVDSGRGATRVRGKGKKNQWVCQACARDVPNKPGNEDQGELFAELTKGSGKE